MQNIKEKRELLEWRGFVLRGMANCIKLIQSCPERKEEFLKDAKGFGELSKKISDKIKSL